VIMLQDGYSCHAWHAFLGDTGMACVDLSKCGHIYADMLRSIRDSTSQGPHSTDKCPTRARSWAAGRLCRRIECFLSVRAATVTSPINCGM
jgi:hypothetical protein